ncbi:MAG: hypothetical protein ACTJGR_09110 [Pauljensenia sp.]
MSASHLSVPLWVPPPDRAALARARRIVHEGGPTRRDLLYRAYVAVLLMVMLGIPLLTGLTSAVPAHRAGDVMWTLRAWCALPLVLVAVAPTHLGPVITSAGELHHLVDGPFGSRRVLLGRTWTVLGAVVVSVAAVAATVGAGLGLGAGAVTTALGWVVGQAALVFLALLGIQTRAAVPARVLALVAGGGLGALCLAGTRAGWPLGGGVDVLGAVVLGICACLVAAVVPPLLDQVPLRVLEHDVRMRHLIRTGLGTGDVKALGVHDGPRRRRLRGRTLPLGGGVLRRSVSVDLIGLMRTPARTAGAVLALVAAGTWLGYALVTTFGGGSSGGHGASGETGAGGMLQVLTGAGHVPAALLAPAALLGAQWAFGVLSRSLTDVLESLGAGRLDPAPFARVLLSHLALPSGAVLVLTGAGMAVPVVAGGGDAIPAAWPAVCAGLALLALVAPCTGLAMAASSSPPLALLTPSPSPFGDSSSLVVVAWMLRGLTSAALLGITMAVAAGQGLSQADALAAGAALLAPVCAVAVGLRLRALARLDRHGRGEAPTSE